jgi:DNA-binding CsgD family transcriptional regulator
MNDSLSILYANVNIGESYISIKEIDSAIKYTSFAEKLNSEINNSQAKASILGNNGKIYSIQGDYQKSIDYLNRSMKISYDNSFSSFIIDNYYLLIEDYQNLGKTVEAIKVFEKLDHYKDSLYEANTQRNIEALQSQLILEEKTAKALYWQQKYKNRNILLALMISVSLLIIILLFLLLKRIKENKKKHREETKNLTFEIDEKNRKLVTLVISENQRKTAFNSLTKAIDSISNEKDINKVRTSLSELKRDLDKNDQIGNRWESFKIHFEKVHPDFFNSLKKIQPNLTQSELRMCAYIKMNLTSKEIANLQNISTRSIQTNRYRLKKKLSLNSKIDLINYIQSL